MLSLIRIRPLIHTYNKFNTCHFRIIIFIKSDIHSIKMSKNESMHFLLSGWMTVILYCQTALSSFSRLSSGFGTLLLMYRPVQGRDHNSPVLVSSFWLPVKCRIELKILLLTYKALDSPASSCLTEPIVPYYSTRQLWSQNTGLFVDPRISQFIMGGGAFSYQTQLEAVPS